MSSALIIIDMQNDFLPGGSLAVPQGNQVIPIINALSHDYSLVVATQDWHPKDHNSFASNHPNKQVFETIELHEQSQTLWPDHCVQGSVGAEITTQIEQENIAAIFRKGMHPEIDSYSAFFDNAHQSNTGLHGYLKDKNISEIFLCGLAADFCVYYSAIDAIQLGYKVTIFEKAVKAINDKLYSTLKIELKNQGVLFK